MNYLTHLGAEYDYKNAVGGTSITMGLYNQSTDALGKDATLSDITTEPTGSNYSRASTTFNVTQTGTKSFSTTYVDDSTFTVSGDETNRFVEDRRIQADLGTDGTVTSHISSSSYDGGSDTTTVNISDSNLTSNLTSVIFYNWKAQTNGTIEFDTSDSTQTVDSYFIVVNFQAEETGDSSANDHLVCFGGIHADRDLTYVDSVKINAGEAGYWK